MRTVSFVSALKAYGVNAYKEVCADRGLLIADFVLATCLPYIVQYLLWSWVYARRGGEPVNGYSMPVLMAYYACVIAFNRLNNGYGVIEYVSYAAHRGRIAALCCKPVGFMEQRLADFIGGSTLYFIPLLLVVAAVEIASGSGLAHAASMFALAAAVALISQALCFYLSFLFAMFSIVLYRPGFLFVLLSASQTVFGGVLAPASFWPAWLEPVMRYNPFRFAAAAPAELITGFSWPLLAEYVAFSAVYILAFRIAASLTWHRLLRKAEVLGG